VSLLAQQTLSFIRRENLLHAGERVAAAVSGGADSVALLRVLLELREELGIVVSVAHFNHQLRGAESDKDAEFVRVLAGEQDLAFQAGAENTAAFANESRLGLEAAARELRHRFFTSLVESGSVSKIATAHTIDDQAETVVMRLLRGAGPAGLAGILPELAPGREQLSKIIVRPFLAVRRHQVREYLKSLCQTWREDTSNCSDEFLRNRVRRELLPQLEKFNPRIVDALSHSAEIARAEEEFWAEKIEALLSDGHRSPCTLELRLLCNQPIALQRRLIRALAMEAGLTLDFEHVEEIRCMLVTTAPKTIEVEGGQAQIKDKKLSFAHGRGRNRAHALHPVGRMIQEVRDQQAVQKRRNRGTMPNRDSH
jgi:tRNA(Ile)-lysidine synthase